MSLLYTIINCKVKWLFAIACTGSGKWLEVTEGLIHACQWENEKKKKKKEATQREKKMKEATEREKKRDESRRLGMRRETEVHWGNPVSVGEWAQPEHQWSSTSCNTSLLLVTTSFLFPLKNRATLLKSSLALPIVSIVSWSVGEWAQPERQWSSTSYSTGNLVEIVYSPTNQETIGSIRDDFNKVARFFKGKRKLVVTSRRDVRAVIFLREEYGWY